MNLSVSIGEIVREGIWALRGLGYPLGVADRAIDLVARAQAINGLGLTLLRLGGDRIARSARLGAPGRQRDGAMCWAIDAKSRCLLETGPPALDLASSDAQRTGFGHVSMRGVFGMCVAEGLYGVAERRGLSAVLVFGSGLDEAAPDRLSASGWVIACSIASKTTVLAGPLEDTADTMAPFLADLYTGAGAAWLERIRADFDLARGSANGSSGYIGISILCPSASGPDPRGTRLALEHEGLRVRETDYPQRIEQAHRVGVVTPRPDLENLYALERRTWAPSSERSRRQAGF